MRALACLALVGGLLAADDVYKAPSPEPTPEETLLLEYLNRCRADPTADSLRIAPEGATPQFRSKSNIDFAMFREEMAKIPPAQPLVFELHLLDSARKHAHYMIRNELGHFEDPGKAGYTGNSPSDRAKAAGWGGGAAEDAFRDAGDPWGCHCGFIIDWGDGGTGGMQAGRGHRTNMTNPGYKVVGVSALPHDGKLSVVHNLSGCGERYAGGVTYIDRDHDGFYGIGEGRGAVDLQVGEAKAASWTSGAFAIQIPATACTLVLRASGQELRREIPAGDKNVKIDWIIPQEQELAAADKLLAAIDAVKDPGSSAARKARVALLIAAGGLSLDDARTARVKELTAGLGEQLATDQTAVRSALDGEAKALKAALATAFKNWRGTAAEAWFTEADTVSRAKLTVDTLIAEKGSPTRARALVKELRATAATARDSTFRAALTAQADRAQVLVGSK